ncbi:MAG: hypothetical protein K6G87_16810, partial [Butyrivibrio sp.]|uniref:hypothetical protein n=1 Tax=Butyrivibrio sp. TaxID=28121 RepID=UPI0025CEA685
VIKYIGMGLMYGAGGIAYVFSRYPVQCILVVVAVVMLFFNPVLGLLLAMVAGLYIVFDLNRTKTNLRKLWEYLNANCERLGCVKNLDKNTIAPAFVNQRLYATTYEDEIKKFIDACENKYITNDKELRWAEPLLSYLEQNKMADVYELEKVSSNQLQYTHSTPDGLLIFNAMSGLCATKIENGNHKYSRIKLEEDGIRKEMNLPSSSSVEQYYLWAFKAEDTSNRIGTSMGNIETEEISADDLGIDM